MTQLLSLTILLTFLTATHAEANPKAVKPASKKTYMDCQTSNSQFTRVVLKGQKKNDVLSDIEVILVNNQGKSLVYNSADTLDGRYLDPQTLSKKHIMVVAQSKDSLATKGMIENPTAVSLFQSEDAAAEDMSCLAAEMKVNNSEASSRKILNEMKYQKFSGTLHHKNKLLQLSCFSPMIPKSSPCSSTSDLKNADDSDLSSL